MNLDNFWFEKYRPKTLDDIVLPAETRKVVESFRDKAELTNHLLLVSSPGQGKTSLAKIIVQDILKCDYLYINASDENGIDTVRATIINFAKTRSFNGDIKVILCDEFDNFTTSGQRALRNVMEEYAANTRFILTANYRHRIIEAIRSRCMTLTLNHNIQDVVKRCYSILKREHISVSEDQKAAFIELVKRGFPDFRKIINELQKHSIDGVLNIEGSDTVDFFITDVFNRIKQSPFEARKFTIQHESTFQSDYHDLMKKLLERVYSLDFETSKKQEAILVITEYMYRHAFVADAEINFFACVINLHKVIESSELPID